MKVALYFIVYSSLVLGLFSAVMYLMTVVDPDLMDLPRKAALMSYHSGHNYDQISRNDDDDDENHTVLPLKHYMDYADLLANITKEINSPLLD